MEIEALLKDPAFVKRVEELATKRINELLIANNDIQNKIETIQRPYKVTSEIMLLITAFIWIYQVFIYLPNQCNK